MKFPAAVKRNRGWWLAMGLIVVTVLVVAGRAVPDSGTSDDRLYALAGQLKCMQCAGESAASSQTTLAAKFRDEIRDQMDSGATDDEILGYFADRYGEQVLLQPPTRGAGALVWVLPIVVVGAALVGLAIGFDRWRTTSIGSAPEHGVPGRHPRWRVPVVLGSVGVFVVLTGWLVVSGSDDRGGANLTGASANSSQQLAKCRPLAMQKPEEAIGCYDKVLSETPGDVEALTYRGWAKVRVGDTAGGSADLQRAVEVDPHFPDARVFRAVVASDAGDFHSAAAELTKFYANDPSADAVQVVSSQGLERKIFFGLMDRRTLACWQQTAQAGGEGGKVDQVFMKRLGTCLDTVLASTSTDPDARLSRALAAIGSGDEHQLGSAEQLIEGLLREHPDDPNALTLQITNQIEQGDLDSAAAGLARLDHLPRAQVAFLIGDSQALRQALSARRSAEVPNPDGG